MKNQKKKFSWRHGLSVHLFLIIFLVGTFGCETPGTIPGCNEEKPTTEHLPIVFVHGGAGSADQFSLQAQRFASNGYPADLISGFEYDTTLASNTLEEIMTGIDAHIDAVLAETGADQVNLLGHSMGTMMSQRYLNSSKERAAKVAHYVNIDGRESLQLPGGVPTLAIWAPMSGGEREITGGTNVTLPGQTHVQSASSAEAFFEMYKFFTGKEPQTVEVLPEDSNTIVLAGKLTMFATNLIPEDYTIDIYEVNPETGARISETPLDTQAIDAGGKFNFQGAAADKTYEFATHSPANGNITQHFYYESFVRSDLLMRLKLSEQGGTLSGMVDTSAEQTNLTVVRNKELVGDARNYPEQAPLENDSLKVNGEELCFEASTPANNRTIGLYVFDAGTDGRSNVTESIEDFASIPFVSGVDLYLPSATPPDGTISIVLNSRQSIGLTQVINVPNWSSATDKVTVQFSDL